MSNHYNEQRETINDRLINEIKERRGMGLKKYGVLLKDAPLSRKDLLQHAKEEALDLAEYLQTLIDIEKQELPCEKRFYDWVREAKTSRRN